MNVDDRRFNDIKFARPLKGEPGIPVKVQKPSSARPSLELISRGDRSTTADSSEFSPIKVLQELEAEGTINPVLLKPYTNASFDKEVAMRLKKRIFDPVVDYARNSGRDVEAVKKELKNAILSHTEKYSLAA